MKKQYTITALSLAAAMIFTGCSASELRAKFVGEKSVSQTAVSGRVDVENYDLNECVTLGKYKGVEVDCSASDKDIQERIDTLLQEKSVDKKKGKAKKGQTVKIDFEGKVDGKAFDGGSAQDYSLELGSDTFIKGFEDGIVGMKVGEKKDLNLKFPDSYGNAELAGKDVVFSVTLNAIVEMAEFNDAFVKKNTEYSSVDEYKKETRKSIVETNKQSAASTAMDTIISDAKVNKRPESLMEVYKGVADSYNRYYLSMYYGESADFDTLLGQMGMTKEQYEEQLVLAAQNNVDTVLVIESIAAKENITVTDEELKENVDQAVSGAGVSSVDELYSQFESMYGKTISYEDFLKFNLLTQKVMDFVEESIVLKE